VQQESGATRQHAHTVNTHEPAKGFNFFADSSRGLVFLLLCAFHGSRELNLTNASYVVLYDSWWNPAVEAQAIADVLGEEGFARSLTTTDLEYLFAED
jgi:hypothetical protein